MKAEKIALFGQFQHCLVSFSASFWVFSSFISTKSKYWTTLRACFYTVKAVLLVNISSFIKVNSHWKSYILFQLTEESQPLTQKEIFIIEVEQSIAAIGLTGLGIEHGLLAHFLSILIGGKMFQRKLHAWLYLKEISCTSTLYLQGSSDRKKIQGLSSNTQRF